jgi:polyvinyl alcohol dehydrogenase (cytochrome)
MRFIGAFAPVGRSAGRVAGSALALGAAIAMIPPAAAGAAWPVYGHDLANSRDAGADGPTSRQVSSIQQAWAFKSSTGDFTATPVVAGGVLVAGNNGGWVYALDAVKGKVLWSRNVGQPINGSAAIDLNARGGPLALVPVGQIGRPRLLALSLKDGAVRWDTVLTRQSGADVFGSPTFWRGAVYIGTSGPNTDNTTARGSVVAVDEKTGGMRWQTFTVPPGHDGAAVWSTPAIDTATGRLYVGTGNNYHPPTTSTEDSMMVLATTTGHILGHYQATANDSFSLPNNPTGPDLDFGASPNLVTGPRGEQLVGEGQKSGIYWALDRATMRPVWHTTIGPGSAVGGILGSTAYDGRRIYGANTASGQVFGLTRGGAMPWESLDVGGLHWSPTTVAHGVLYTVDPAGFLTARNPATGTILAKLPLGGPSFGGVSAVGRAIYVAVGTGPPPAPAPQNDGSGSIIAFGDTSGSGAGRATGGGRASTFDGRCQFSGAVAFDPALSNSPHALEQSVRAPGACSGTLVDRDGRAHQLSNAPVTYLATEHADTASCAAGTATGSGTLVFPYGQLRFAESETRATAAVVASFSGAKGGSARGVATPSDSENPVTIAQQCATSGIKKADINIELSTTPTIAG